MAIIGSELLGLIKEFQGVAKVVVTEFYNVYGRKDLLTAVISDKIIPRQGKLNNVVYRYGFHGIGLSANIKGRSINFDFGPDDRADGFDAWRLMGYLASQPHRDQWALKDIEDCLATLEKHNKIVKGGGDDDNYYLTLQ